MIHGKDGKKALESSAQLSTNKAISQPEDKPHTQRVCVCVCVCVCERERERGRERQTEREREQERERDAGVQGVSEIL